MRRLVCHKVSVEYCMQYWDDYQATSMKALEHMFQNGIQNRFQEYSPMYMKGEEFRDAPLVPIETISEVPIYIFVAANDLFCPYDQALWTAEQIGEAVREVRVFDGQDHDYFTYSHDTVLMESLLHTLGAKENRQRTKFHHDWASWETNNEIGFAPYYKHNKREEGFLVREGYFLQL